MDERDGAAPPRPGEQLLELVAVMARLRQECPWDARQTHETLAPHLLEESYEALEALESGDPEALCEELGDVLLQVVFHAEVASERADGTGYTIDDVAEQIAAKLVRRHPHVYGDVSVSGADEVKQNWDAIKAAEREAKSGGPGSVLDGVPFGSPPWRSPPSCSGARSGPGRRRPWPTWTRAGTGSRARSGPSCSRSWPGPARPGLTRNWSCARPPAPTATGSWPGSTPGGAEAPARGPAPAVSRRERPAVSRRGLCVRPRSLR